MACQHCGASDTIKAHLIPEAFVMEVKADRGEQLLILLEGQDRPQVSNTGTYDPDLLCGACDGILGRWEGYAFSLFKRLRAIKGDIGSIVPMGSVDGDMVLRFAAGIAWKYTATRPHFGRIDIGPYDSLLKDVALGNALSHRRLMLRSSASSSSTATSITTERPCPRGTAVSTPCASRSGASSSI